MLCRVTAVYTVLLLLLVVPVLMFWFVVLCMVFERGRGAGLRVVSVLPESVAAAAKQLKQPEALLREKSVFCLRALVDGAAGVGGSVHGDALKAALKSAGDRWDANDCPLF